MTGFQIYEKLNISIANNSFGYYSHDFWQVYNRVTWLNCINIAET